MIYNVFIFLDLSGCLKFHGPFCGTLSYTRSHTSELKSPTSQVEHSNAYPTTPIGVLHRRFKSVVVEVTCGLYVSLNQSLHGHTHAPSHCTTWPLKLFSHFTRGDLPIRHIFSFFFLHLFHPSTHCYTTTITTTANLHIRSPLSVRNFVLWQVIPLIVNTK